MAALFFSSGLVLMAWGYFGRYSPSLELVYVFGVGLWAISYILFFGILLRGGKCFTNWVYLFFLFPKKALPEGSEGLLAHWFGSERVSFYEVFEVVIIVAMVLNLLTSGEVPGSRRKGSIRWYLALSGYSLLVAVGLLHVALRFAGVAKNYGTPLEMLHELWPMMAGLAILVAARHYLRFGGTVDTVRNAILLAGLLLVLEFLISEYVPWIPNVMKYYEFNVDTGGFRSAWQSTGLEAGLLVGILLIVALPFLYLSLWNRSRVGASIAMFLGLWVVAYTYWRGPLVAAFGALVVAFWYRYARWRLAAVLGLATCVVVTMANPRLKYQIVDSLGLQNAKDVGTSYFNVDTLFERIGAQRRGLEIIAHYPIAGCGPGNVSMAMADPSVKSWVNVTRLNPGSADMYSHVLDPKARTDTHNLAVNVLAQYGLAGLPAILCFLACVLRGGLRLNRQLTSRRRTPGLPSATTNIAGFAGLVGMILYYTTQAGPVEAGLLALLYHLSIYRVAAADA